MDQFSRFLSPPSDPAQRSYGQLRTPDDRLLNPVKDRAPTTHRWTPTWGWGSLSMPRSDGTGQRSHTPSGVHLWRTDSSTSSNLHRSDSTSSHLHRVDSSRLVRVDSTTSRLARTDSSTSRPAHPLSRGSTDGASLVRSDSNTSWGVKHPTLTTVSGTMKKGDGMLSPTLEE
ncbi:hypothetical protein BC829DRAFT_398168 [Chytridium lagenaria]|nr:hypothetical protein BC829DRAFT_398168 [Chytridium lagenaria]